jgi:hypothetical protein
LINQTGYIAVLAVGRRCDRDSPYRLVGRLPWPALRCCAIAMVQWFWPVYVIPLVLVLGIIAGLISAFRCYFGSHPLSLPAGWLIRRGPAQVTAGTGTIIIPSCL